MLQPSCWAVHQLVDLRQAVSLLYLDLRQVVAHLHRAVGLLYLDLRQVVALRRAVGLLYFDLRQAVGLLYLDLRPVVVHLGHLDETLQDLLCTRINELA